ncbi:MAG: hypothetical protein J5I52_08260 [Saprospiraceae bacterium]|nr:hypothetical protein [Saprospiraceae bacterium]
MALGRPSIVSKRRAMPLLIISWIFISLTLGFLFYQWINGLGTNMGQKIILTGATWVIISDIIRRNRRN